MTLAALAEFLIVLAEFTFVACFLANEVTRYALRGRITRFEQLAHSIPDDRYLSQFSLPLITLLAGAAVGAGAGLVTSLSSGFLAQEVGVAILIVTVIPFCGFQLRAAAGIAPRPVSRARLRRLLSEADSRLSAPAELSPEEVMTLRTTLTRIMRVGDRVALRQDSGRWRDTIRRERRLLTVAAAQVILFAVFVGSLAVVRSARGDRTGLLALGIAFLLAAGDLAAVLLRRIRCSREQHDLGVELRSESARLLARLEALPPADSQSPAAARVVSAVRAFTRKWLGSVQRGDLGTRQAAPDAGSRRLPPRRSTAGLGVSAGRPL